MDDVVNTATFSVNKPAAVATETSQSPHQLSDNKNAVKFCLKCQQEYSSAHSLRSYGKVVHAICGIKMKQTKEKKITCRLCHNKQEITNKR